MVKIYTDEAAHQAAAKSQNESDIYLVEKTNTAGADGTNVVTDCPEKGDIYAKNEKGEDIYIKRESYKAASLPASISILGVVLKRVGNIVIRIPKSFTSKRYMAVYPYVLTAYPLDGSSHTITFSLHGSAKKAFTYTSSSDEAFVDELAAWLVKEGFADWNAYRYNGETYLQYTNYNEGEYPGKSTFEGVTATPKCVIDNPEAASYQMRKCGTTGCAIHNLGRALVWFKNDQSSTAYNPSTVIKSVPSYPVCFPGFCGISAHQAPENCAYLRERYCVDPAHPTEEDWKRYMADLLPVLPSFYGGCSSELVHGEEICNKLKDIKVLDGKGEEIYLYSAIRYAADSIDGGYIADMSEWAELFGDITSGLPGVSRSEADVVNRALYAIGGSDLTCTTNSWVASRNVAGLEWIAYGIGGFVDSSFCNGLRVVPLSLKILSGTGK